MGKGSLAIRVAEWFIESDRYELAQVVPTVPEPAWADSLIQWAKRNGIRYVASGRYDDLESVRNDDWRTDLVFSVFYDRIFRPWFIAKCGQILNVHNGPLPRYRGVSPINWALKNGEPEHGVTIHEVTPGIDDGPIVAQLKYSIYPAFDEVVDVYNRALEYGWALFRQTMPLLERIEPRPQDEAAASYYSVEDNLKLGERRGFTSKESV